MFLKCLLLFHNFLEQQHERRRFGVNAHSSVFPFRFVLKIAYGAWVSIAVWCYMYWCREKKTLWVLFEKKLFIFSTGGHTKSFKKQNCSVVFPMTAVQIFCSRINERSVRVEPLNRLHRYRKCIIYA